MARRQIEWPKGEDRAVAALSSALANAINNDDPNVTDDKLREDVRLFSEFLRVLMAMDAEQKNASK